MAEPCISHRLSPNSRTAFFTEIRLRNKVGAYVDNSSPRYVNCEFSFNTALRGGGIYASTGSQIEIGGFVPEDMVDFILNSAVEFGGGVYLEPQTSANFFTSRFFLNSASTSGGGIYSDRSGAIVFLSDFVGNYSGSDGGGGITVTDGGSELTVEFSTFCSNEPVDILGDYIGDPDFNQFNCLILDCNLNGIPDVDDLESGADDCDHDGILDECEIDFGSESDLDQNSIPDSCQSCFGSSGSSEYFEPLESFPFDDVFDLTDWNLEGPLLSSVQTLSFLAIVTSFKTAPSYLLMVNFQSHFGCEQTSYPVALGVWHSTSWCRDKSQSGLEHKKLPEN